MFSSILVLHCNTFFAVLFVEYFVTVFSCVCRCYFCFFFFLFFFCKQNTEYEMRISDWSSDVCSSDLGGTEPGTPWIQSGQVADPGATDPQQNQRQRHDTADRSADGGDARADDSGNRRLARICWHGRILASVPRYGVKS